MKFLFVLLLLVSCTEREADKQARLKDLDRIQCEQYIEGFEHQLTSGFKFGSYDICDLDPHNDLCGCGGIDKLPFNEFETHMKFDKKIEAVNKSIKDMKDIIRTAKKSKHTKKGMEILNELLESYKRDLEELKNNLSFYDSLIKYNKERADEIHRADEQSIQSRN